MVMLGARSQGAFSCCFDYSPTPPQVLLLMLPELMSPTSSQNGTKLPSITMQMMVQIFVKYSVPDRSLGLELC